MAATHAIDPESGGPLASLRECPDCGQVQQIAHLRPGETAVCERCGALLRRRRRNSLDTTAALACAALFLLFAAMISPLLGFRLAGRDIDAGLAALPMGFEARNMPFLAIVVLATTMVAPFLRLLLTVLVVVGLRGNLSRGSLITIARLRNVLRPWAMTEVFLLGLFVAYTRLTALAQVTIGSGLYALGALMVLTAWSDSWLDEDALWDEIGRQPRRDVSTSPEAPGAMHGRLMGCDTCGQVSRGGPGHACPRCDMPLSDRKPKSLSRTWALLVTAAVLYVPANVYPVMTVVQLGRGLPSTILGGVQELAQRQMWPLAILVLTASVLVPMLKLFGLGTLLILTQSGSGARLVDRTRLFRLIDFIGRWSMIDVFMLSILTALVQVGAIANVTPGYGAVAFACVVLLTMLAAQSFDPRLMWDAAGTRAVVAEEIAEGASV